jgi:hypothetical protein
VDHPIFLLQPGVFGKSALCRDFVFAILPYVAPLDGKAGVLNKKWSRLGLHFSIFDIFF